MYAAVVLLLGLMLSGSLPQPSPDAPVEGEEADPSYCFRCHSNTAKLVDVISDLWRYEDLLIDPEDYRRSNHSNMFCIDCHPFTWPFFPHPDNAGSEDLSCLGCHKNQKRFGKYHFDYIEQEYGRSVHKEKLPNSFSCFSCHDPHKFDIPNPDQEISYTVENSNDLCRKCHLSRMLFADLTSRPLPRLEKSHDWLPNPRLHWRHVRCIECHTPHARDFSHRILSAQRAERLCEQCHTKNSILLMTLYKHRTADSRQRLGFANSVVFNNAYIIGMTRNTILDRVFLGISVLVFLCIGGHAALRIGTAAKRKHGH